MKSTDENQTLRNSRTYDSDPLDYHTKKCTVILLPAQTHIPHIRSRIQLSAVPSYRRCDPFKGRPRHPRVLDISSGVFTHLAGHKPDF